MKPNLRIVKVSVPEEMRKTGASKENYKIQKRFLGCLWWDDLTEPENGMTYPTFDTLEEAEAWVARMYFQKEIVVKEYEVENQMIL
jgi:hypothetical protein